MLVGEATIEIDLIDFWGFVKQNHPELGETLYGVPRINKAGGLIEIDVAFSQTCHPESWAEKSNAQKQWEEIK